MGIPALLHLDDGCCIVCCNATVRKKNGWALAPVSSGNGVVKFAGGEAPRLEGEVHNVIFEFNSELKIPMNILSIENLSCDYLIGRPMLESTRALIDSAAVYII